MTFEDGADYVRGEIVQRSMPDYIHGRIQALLAAWFDAVRSPNRLYPCSEVRVKLGDDLYRIPEVMVFAKPPENAVPEKPPLVAIEIMSKDDRHSDLMEKLEECRVFGVPHIWVVDPILRRLSRYTEGGLQNASSLALPGYPLELTPAALFSDL
jgi:Uma2 family endonuclease